MESNPIRILQVVPNMQAGGLESLIMNLYRNIDRDKIQFDFIVHYTEKKHFDDEIESLGGKIYRFSLREDNNIFKYIKQLDKFFKEHKEYKIIHCHMSSIGFLVFLIAKKNGIKIRIAHSHNTSTERNLKGIIKSILIKPYKYVATVNLACSNEAGKYLYGKKKFKVIKNGVDVSKFRYNEQVRNEKRKELKIENDFVLGHIGRIEPQKNHLFLLEIVKCMVEKNKNTKLLIVGTGILEEDVKKRIKELGIEENVKMLGVRSDVNELYQAMDAFCLPSLFEGLPLVAVEAQMSGLPCYFSDVITKECRILDSSKYISLNESAEYWATEILKSNKKQERVISDEIINKSGFDIKNTVKEIEEEIML